MESRKSIEAARGVRESRCRRVETDRSFTKERTATQLSFRAEGVSPAAAARRLDYLIIAKK